MTSRMWWFSALCLLALAGPVTGNSGFYGFLGFMAFLIFRKADERDQVNLGRAGVVAYAVTIFLCASSISTLALLASNRNSLGWQAGDFLAFTALSIGAILGASALTFGLSYEYYDRQGK